MRLQEARQRSGAVQARDAAETPVEVDLVEIDGNGGGCAWSA
jgi:hypothetical protein